MVVSLPIVSVSLELGQLRRGSVRLRCTTLSWQTWWMFRSIVSIVVCNHTPFIGDDLLWCWCLVIVNWSLQQHHLIWLGLKPVLSPSELLLWFAAKTKIASVPGWTCILWFSALWCPILVLIGSINGQIWCVDVRLSWVILHFFSCQAHLFIYFAFDLILQSEIIQI